MPNRPPQKSHKRQKSSILNIGYYLPSDQQDHQHTQTTPIQNIHSNIYEHETYSTNYNFPQRGPLSYQKNSDGNFIPGNRELENEIAPHSTHNSPLKRSASSDEEDIIPQKSASINLAQTQAPFFNFPPHLQSTYSQGDASTSSTSAQNYSGVNFQPPASSSSSYAHPPIVPNVSYNQTHPPIIPLSNVPFPTNYESSGVYLSGASFPKIDYSPHSQLSPSTKIVAPPSKKHQKNNLSISSHFNLFNLNEDTAKQSPTQPTNDTIVNELLVNLITVDGSNINNYLLDILSKLNTPFPVDDFYNLLYNSDKLHSLLQIHYQNKIDKTINSGNAQLVEIINQLLNIFKNPDLLSDYFMNINIEDNKLTNINYHELLRTFLAIKILFDILIQLPLNSNEEPQNYTIPRLSIYKTYYIICQKLIMTYPSSSNTTNEQQKLILGQSKLGKLIKLVYPNLLIKRLGSRGESKYNYLGVVWNENIINDEIKNLCEKNELVDLNNIFQGEKKLLKSNPLITPKKGQRKSFSKPKIRVEKQSNSEIHQSAREYSHPEVDKISTPNLSFIKPFLKYPSDDNFTVLNDEENWFNDIRVRIYSTHSSISKDSIHDVFLNNDSLKNPSSLLSHFMAKLVTPLNTESSENTDLSLYLIILLEVLPFLLLIKSSANIDFLKNLRINLLYLINNFNTELRQLNSPRFNINNSTVFLILLKKLINLNVLLITFIKLIIKDDTKSVMSVDIENFLRVNSPSNSLKYKDGQDDDSFFLNLNSNIATNSLGEMNFSFKNDILSNDLVYTLIGYNFDPAINSDLKSSLSMNFINQEINIIDEFFKKDLLSFLNDSGYDTDSSNGSDQAGEGELRISHGKLGGELRGLHGEDLQGISQNTEADNETGKEALLSAKERSKLVSLISLIDKRLLSTHFKSKYPILIYNNFINFVLNDILKFIFLKQQQLQLQNIQGNIEADVSQNSFGNWWVFNSFIQEYMSLMGEIVGLLDLL